MVVLLTSYNEQVGVLILAGPKWNDLMVGPKWKPLHKSLPS
jgi:hypothetical protein